MIVKSIKKLLVKLSRGIFYLIPKDYKFLLKLNLRNKLQIKLEENLAEETFNHFKEHIKKSVVFEDKWSIRKYAIETALLSDKNKEYYYLEFGVYTGSSSNFLSNYVKKIYAFDSFKGLKEDWVGKGKPKGYFSLDGKIPILNSNVEAVVGWVEDTLDEFLKKHNPKINFIHFDMDTYSSTKFVLEKIKPYLLRNSILLFDQYYNYLGWEHGEYKAFKEVFKESEFEYKSFNTTNKETVILIK